MMTYAKIHHNEILTMYNRGTFKMVNPSSRHQFQQDKKNKKQDKPKQFAAAKKSIKHMGQRFLYYERKVSTYFFWLFLFFVLAVCVIGRAPKTMNWFFMLLFLIIAFAITAFIGKRICRYYFLKYHWQRYVIAMVRQLVSIYQQLTGFIKRYPYTKVFVVSAVIIVSSVWLHSAFAGYRLQPLPDRETPQQRLDGQQGWLLGSDFNLNDVQGSIANTRRQKGYFGFDVYGGYRFVIDQRQTLTPTLGFAVNSKSVFSGMDQTITTSLYDLSGILKYHYYVGNGIKLGAGVGLGFVYGWIERDDRSGQHAQGSRTSFYRNIAPILGLYSGYQLTRSLSIDTGFSAYLPYLLKSQQTVYGDKSAIPTIYRLSFGVSYVF